MSRRRKVVVTAPSRRTRTVTTALGWFRVSLGRPAPRACNTLVVRATGARGDWALLRIGSPECNPPGWRSTP